jgi:hypothetical protein
MSSAQGKPEPMSRADMATLESALRNGWAIPGGYGSESNCVASRPCWAIHGASTGRVGGRSAFWTWRWAGSTVQKRSRRMNNDGRDENG